MRSHYLQQLLDRVRSVFHRGRTDGADDAALLGGFLRGDEEAFALLVERHGPMVFAVCRRVLAHEQDAEDAFQATFLVLARKAGSLRRAASVSAWLHRVAFRIALASKCAARRRREVVLDCPHETAPEPESEWLEDDLHPILEEELQRLPEKYREPVVLCHLEGKTHAETAALLGWPVGTVAGRLSRARDLLRSRLSRRGVMLSAAALGTFLTEKATAALPPGLAATVASLARPFVLLSAAGGTAAPQAAQLAQGCLAEMARARTALLLTVLLILMTGGTAVALFFGLRGDEPPTPDDRPAPPVIVELQPPLPLDPAAIPVGQREPGMPPEVVAVLADKRGRHAEDLRDLNTVDFSPDGKFLVSGTAWAMHVWDAATLRELAVLRTEGGTGAVRFSPDGKLLVSAGSGVRVWTVGDEGPVLRETVAIPGLRCHGVCFATTGQTVAVWDARIPGEPNAIVLFDLSGPRALRLGSCSCPGAVGFSADAQTLFVAGRGAIHRWSLAGKEFRGLKPWPLDADEFGEQVSRDGKTVFTVIRKEGKPSLDHDVRVWDVSGPKPAVRSVIRGNCPLNSSPIAFDPVRGLAVFRSLHERKQLVHVFDVSTPQAAERASFDAMIWPVGLSPDGQTLAVLKDKRLVLWDADSLTASREPHLRLAPLGHDGGAGEVRTFFTPDGRAAVTVGGNTARLWGLATGRVVHQDELGGLCESTEPNLPVAALSADGLTLVCRRRDRFLDVFRISEGRFRQVPAKGQYEDDSSRLGMSADALALSPDGSRLAGVARGGVSVGPTTNLRSEGWTRLDLETDDRNRVSVLANPPVQFSADGQKLFVIGETPALYTFDVSGDKPWRERVCRFPGLKQWGGPALSPEGDLLACWDADGKSVGVWDVTGESARLRVRVPAPAGPLALGPGGKTLVTASWHTPNVFPVGEVRVWDVASGRLRQHWDLRNHVLSISFHPDGRHLALGKRDGNVYVLRLP